MDNVDATKCCTKCKAKKSMVDFYRPRDSWCKKCLLEQQRKTKSERQIEKIRQRSCEIEEKKIHGKICIQCGQKKQLAEFKTDRTKKTGCSGRCKACSRSKDRASHKRHYVKHKLKVKARVQKYRDGNRLNIGDARRVKRKRETIDLGKSYLQKLLNPRGVASINESIPESLIETKKWQVLINRELQERNHEIN